MTPIDLIECIDWIAPGFELVYSIFPNWEFTAADAAAAYGVHGALIVGERLNVTGALADRLAELSTFVVELESNCGTYRKGHARNVLGGPLDAFKFLVEEIARYAISEPLRAGEIVTTGTLTEAMPARPGETWTARFEGIELTPMQLCFE
jgi:2-oxo-3-hexenedioate decarboxylase